MYINESCRTRTFEVSALLRSVQNRHPPDVVHRLALNQKEVRTDIYARVLPDSNGSYLRSTSVGANGSPMDFQHPVSRNEGLRRTRTVRIFVPLRSVQDCVFFSFIRDEGVAGAFFSVTSQHTGHWPGLF